VDLPKILSHAQKLRQILQAEKLKAASKGSYAEQT
jgi:hypothetical protein